MATSRKSTSSRKRKYGCATMVAAFLLFFVWIATMHDPPYDYSSTNSEILRERIMGHEEAIRISGDTAASVDGDRYWPYDRDRAVLAMFLFREKTSRWPHTWEKLLESDIVQDESCIHDNWELVISGDGWEIFLHDSWKIAFFQEK